MKTIILIIVIIVLLTIFRKAITSRISKVKDRRLRKWCVKQAALSHPYDMDDDMFYATPFTLTGCAKNIYLFVKHGYDDNPSDTRSSSNDS